MNHWTRKTTQHEARKSGLHLFVLVVFMTALITCSGDQGAEGPSGTVCWDLNGNGTCDIASEDNNNDGACTVADCWPNSVGRVSGTVINTLTKTPVAGVDISLDPALPDTDLTTNDSGNYSISLPTGVFKLMFEKENFNPVECSVNIAAGLATIQDIDLEPKFSVLIDAGADLISSMGAAIDLSGTLTILDGSTVTNHAWTQKLGAQAELTGTDTQSLHAVLPGIEKYKEQLIAYLLPPDRLMVVGINPDALEKTKTITFEYTVTTTSGTYKDSVQVSVDLPFTLSTGLQNVPTGVPVVVHGKNADPDGYDWTLDKPENATATLDDGTSQYPVYIPDLPGCYTLTNSVSASSIDIYADDWYGCVHGQDEHSRPTSIYCGTTGFCHGDSAPVTNQVFSQWAYSGHAEIFTDNLNLIPYQKESCFVCHTVGYDKTAQNQGIDDQDDYDDFIASGMMSMPDTDNCSTMLTEYSLTAAFTNVQCENCHGPLALNTSLIHFNGIIGDPECVSISSDVCAVCHGQANWYGRHQQWQVSGHGSYASAATNGLPSWPGGVANCGRCHTGQGFLAWIEEGDLTQTIQADTGELGLTPDKVHPVTCTVCHDPHAVGNKTGIVNDATVRLSADTPLLPSGFRAIGVGRGAVCFVCHTTPHGLHNDLSGPMSDWSAPHASSQADVILGENAYFVETGIHSPHAYSIPDTCAKCHMELSPPPEEPGAAGESTNHTFTASLNICSECHAKYDAAGLQKSTKEQLQSLSEKIDYDVATTLNGLGEIWVRAFDLKYRFSSTNPENCDLKIDTSPTSPNRITKIAPMVISEQLALEITLENPIEITWVTSGPPTTVETNKFGLQLRSLKDDNSGGAVIYDLSSNLAKAVWNYLLIISDESYGIHNTGFTYKVISETMLQDLSVP